MSDRPTRKPMPVLPDLQLPLIPWLIAAPASCVLVGAAGYAVSAAIGAQQPLAALYGGVSTAIAMLIAALAILPWVPRPLNHWANLLLGGQLFSFMATIGVGLVVWKATDASPTPLGMTAAAAFLVAQMVQVSVFQSVARPIEKRLQEKSAAKGS